MKMIHRPGRGKKRKLDDTAVTSQQEMFVRLREAMIETSRQEIKKLREEMMEREETMETSLRRLHEEMETLRKENKSLRRRLLILERVPLTLDNMEGFDDVVKHVAYKLDGGSFNRLLRSSKRFAKDDRFAPDKAYCPAPEDNRRLTRDECVQQYKKPLLKHPDKDCFVCDVAFARDEIDEANLTWRDYQFHGESEKDTKERLKLVTIPDGVTRIGEDAFKDCTTYNPERHLHQYS